MVSLMKFAEIPTAIVVLLSLLSLRALAAELPDPALPAGVWVNIHFTNGHAKDLDLIAARGFKVGRNL